jgi:hypothetical protein
MIKAIIFFWLVSHGDGTIGFAAMDQLPSCNADVVQAYVETLPEVPKAYRLEYYCVEPGPTKIVTENEQAN